ncbi:MAG: hypothetical protein M1831_005604 [Alyxoria varia]|nr:MAG: hypothetical protein M1831_005604 [Alyxoria varia]
MHYNHNSTELSLPSLFALQRVIFILHSTLCFNLNDYSLIQAQGDRWRRTSMSDIFSTNNDTEALTLLTNRLLDLIASREPPKTLCPSEIARSFTAAELQDVLGVETWREAMPKVRRAVPELVRDNRVEVLQKGEVLDLDTVEGDLERVKGPFRIRRRVDAERALEQEHK